METSSRSLDSILGAAGPRSGVVGNPDLAAGFLIGSSLLGLLIIIGAFWYHRSNLSLFRRSCIMTFTCRHNSLVGVQIVHRFLVTLLIVDALNLIMTIILGAEMVQMLCYVVIDCSFVEIIWFLCRQCGVIIHLLNASFSVYRLGHPLSGTRVRIFYLFISVLIIIMIPVSRFVPIASVFILAAIAFLSALSVIVASRVSTSSPSTATLKILIMLVAMCNFLVVFIPTFIIQCLLYSSVNDDESMNYYLIIYVNVLVFTNFHLIFNGLHCALVLKLPCGEEEEQLLGSPNPGYTAPTNVNE